MWIISLLLPVLAICASTQNGNSLYGMPPPALPVYLHKDDKGSRALLLANSAPAFDRTTYSAFYNAGRLFCISPMATPITPDALFVFRKVRAAGQAVDHVYTSKPDEMGTATVGQVGRRGYVCMGVIGFVRKPDCSHGGTVGGLRKVYSWYSEGRKLHAYSMDRTFGERLRGGYEFKGVTAYTVPCQMFY